MKKSVLPQSQLHLLQQIERRRRYRNWVTAFQIMTVVFFADQILKTWCRGHIPIGRTQVVLNQTTVQLTEVPKRGFIEDKVASLGSHWLTSAASRVPVLIFILLVLSLWLRLPEASMTELVAFALAIGGSLSNLFSLWTFQSIIETLRWNFWEGRFLLLNLADVALVLGGLALLRRLSRTLVAELRWIWSRQTG